VPPLKPLANADNEWMATSEDGSHSHEGIHLCTHAWWRWILSSSHQDAESVSPTLQSDWTMWLALDHRIMKTWLSRESKSTDILGFAFSFWFLEPYTCPGLAYLMRGTRPCYPCLPGRPRACWPPDMSMRLSKTIVLHPKPSTTHELVWLKLARFVQTQAWPKWVTLKIKIQVNCCCFRFLNCGMIY